MKPFDFYPTGKYSAFLKPFRENDSMLQQAKDLWHSLENWSWAFPIIAIVMGMIFTTYYYTSFNNYAGRHYKPQYWWLGMLVTFIVALTVTFTLEVVIAKPELDGAFMLELKVALVNAFYSVIIYGIISFVWCNTSWTTNAYRYLKIKKS